METNLSIDVLRPYERATEGSMMMWPAIGVLAGVFFASFHFENPAIMGVAIAVYLIGVFVAVGLQAKKTGVQPSFGAMPTELRKNLYGFWACSIVIAVAALLLGFGVNFLVGGLFVGVAFAALGVTYHKRSRQIVAALIASA